MLEKKKRPKALIVGGSIAGISCAHTLIKAGWEVQVLEKSPKPPAGCSTGAGLGLDPLSQRLLQSWLSRPESFLESTSPLTMEQVKFSPINLFFEFITLIDTRRNFESNIFNVRAKFMVATSQ